ncbi:MAG: aldo/keto reductase [Ancylobacter novellus]|uniref:Aldo/keto reductase n=1 Tax=Ancylobacter novellus TaxID=921 RepID=A0A2W5KP14_ANCNO|nr:MAG: aldo/keto reductase [Ancylobacter novellus]
MKQRPLGRTGRLVSEIGLGCMGMSEFYGARDDVESMETLHAAADQGITFFDTADMYGAGHNEELVGRFLKERADALVIATKFGIVRGADPMDRRIDNSPAYVRAACEASLKRLGVEAIDLYYCHRFTGETPIDEVVGAMAELVWEGKVKAIGLSEVSSATLRRACETHHVAALQTEYSLWSREPEHDQIETCRELGVTFVPYSPLGRGFLTGAVPAPAEMPETDFRRMNPRFAGEAGEANAALVDGVRAMAAAKGCEPAQIALAWVLAKQPDAIPIPGTKRRKWLAQNVAATRVELTEDDVAALDMAFDPARVVGSRYAQASMAAINA